MVGIAGGAAKCARVVEQFGFDACVDYRLASSARLLRQMVHDAVPEGIDRLFENVGSTIFDASLANLNPFARIALCGMVAGYDQRAEPLTHVNRLLTMRASLQGFIITEHPEVWPAALDKLTTLVLDKRIVWPETVAQGLAAAPHALIGMLRGENVGKQLVQLASTEHNRT